MHFIFDANLSYRLAKGLQEFESGDTNSVVKKIDHTDLLLGKGESDENIIKEAGKTNAIIISQDDDFKRIKSNKDLIKQLKVGYVMYRPPKRGSRYWDIVESFVIGWQGLKVKLSDEKPPFLFQIDHKGNLSKIDL